MMRLQLRYLVMGAVWPVLTAAAPWLPAPRPHAPGWMARHEQKLAELKQGPVDLVFLGDSIIEELETTSVARGDINAVWRQFYGCRHAVNLGFRGDTTANLLWRIDNGELDGIRPKLAVIMIGTNNIRPAIESTAEDTAHAILAVVADVHTRLPATHILLLGIPPSSRAAATEQERAQVNASLAARDLADQNAEFLQVDQVLAPGGVLDRSLYVVPPGSSGLVHPNALGWQKLANTIEPSIAHLLGEQPKQEGRFCP